MVLCFEDRCNIMSIVPIFYASKKLCFDVHLYEYSLTSIFLLLVPYMDIPPTRIAPPVSSITDYGQTNHAVSRSHVDMDT